MMSFVKDGIVPDCFFGWNGVLEHLFDGWDNLSYTFFLKYLHLFSHSFLKNSLFIELVLRRYFFLPNEKNFSPVREKIFPSEWKLNLSLEVLLIGG
ncbi:MAG: hypothetical protein IJ212_06710 [Bacteroidaceae bacterium]|nr:hypothetical protein [Bacteroidaceae bacterium]